MIVLLGGPAAGAFAVLRAPLFLRAVVDKKTRKIDVLDQLDDAPRPGELIYIYRLASPPSMVMVCIRGKGSVASGLYATGSYLPVEGVDGEPFRDTAAWRTWCEAERARVVASSE